jgi:hypothetical protein
MDDMKTIQITVRNVDPVLKRRFDKLAKLKSMSINDLALEALQDKVGGSPTDKRQISWRQYSSMLPSGAINQSVLEAFGEIDQAMWKDSSE